jgi:hypothetical protein
MAPFTPAEDIGNDDMINRMRAEFAADRRAPASATTGATSTEVLFAVVTR